MSLKPNSNMIELEALVIDDEQAVRRILEIMLLRYGVEPTGRPDGSSGLAEYLEHPGRYDIIITDIKMPGLNGLEVIKSILATSPKENIYSFSGFNHYTREISELIGSDHMFEKPLGLKHVGDVVKSIGTRKLRSAYPVANDLSYIMPENTLAELGAETIKDENGTKMSLVRDNLRFIYKMAARNADRNHVYVLHNIEPVNQL